MEDFLRAISDIQSIDIDKIREQFSQSSRKINQNEEEDWTTKTSHIYQSQKRETDRARKQLEEEQEFRGEYVKVFGERKINALQRMTETLNGDIEKLQRETKRLKEENRSLEEKKQKVLKEKADALTRLSQQMENQITHNSTNIPELKDRNQPNQIREKYAELYDNQWTNAFEVLTQTSGQNDERAVQILLKVLIECYNFATKRSEKQMNDLVQKISGDSTMQVGDEIKHHLRKARQLVDVGRASLLFKECDRHINDNLGSERLFLYEKEMKMYLIECFQLCWLMAIQDPPVVLGTETMYGQDVDLNLYTRCTRYGNRVNFLVLPPLFLYKSGPLLAKGVVQAIEKTSNEKFMKQKYCGDESRTGLIEQHLRGTEEHDLVKMSLYKPRAETNIHGLQHRLKTRSPIATRLSQSSSGMTCDSLHAARDESRESGIGYQMQPVTTSYTQVSDARQQDYQASLPKTNIPNQIHTEDPGILTPKIRNNDAKPITVRNYAQLQANTNRLCSSGTHGYSPLQESENNEFQTFVSVLRSTGYGIAQLLFKDNFDRFYAIYLDRP